jgi:hypothetical protein
VAACRGKRDHEFARVVGHSGETVAPIEARGPLVDGVDNDRADSDLMAGPQNA